jgi:hypothetical protein
MAAADPTGSRIAATEIADRVRDWLAILDPRQRSRAVFPFDTSERSVWGYVPGPREGLALGGMDLAQREAAIAIVTTAMSHRGATEIASVIALETILGELERVGGRSGWIRRDPDLYWFAAFGEPDADSPWSWRVGGHHIAIQQTFVGATVIGSGPSFLGANPAVVPHGPSAGARALTGEETLARELLASLTPEQRRIAVADAVAPPDIRSGAGPRADVRDIPFGVRHDALDHSQRDRLDRLIRQYLDRARTEVAAMEWERIHGAGLEGVTFAWAGSDAPGRGHYYAVRGPRFLIEYDNTQNGANHIHSVWRDLANDWGEDLLAAHYRTGHSPAP